MFTVWCVYLRRGPLGLRSKLRRNLI